MRITGGRWRGRRLEAVTGGKVRPTTDRVREALFNILGGSVDKVAVADLCCGSGALGIEALSRGAAHVDFVDLAPASLAATGRNLERCGAAADSWHLHRSDAARWLARRLDRQSPLVVLADPPYGGGAADRLLEVILDAPAGCIAVAAVEQATGGPEPVVDPRRWICETRRYGSTSLTILRPQRPGAAEDRHE
jgi:16S rRNA (guanine966-N2)-methyltransferase